MSTASTEKKSQDTPVLVGVCPTCSHRTRFSYAGEQHWPPHIARAAGLPTVVRLWHCLYCQSTISELDIES